MSATTDEVVAPMEVTELPAPRFAQRARWVIEDSLVITKRNLLVWYRVPAFIVFTLVQPVMFTLLFRYVFGGAITVPGLADFVCVRNLCIHFNMTNHDKL